VGKSIITAGLGRIFADEGFTSLPSKAQTCRLNSAANTGWQEIGRAQALQAEPCRVPPSVEMNQYSSSRLQMRAPGSIARQGVGAGERCRLPYWSVESYFQWSFRAIRNLPLTTTSFCWRELDLLRKSTYVTTISLTSAWHTHRCCVPLVGDIDRGGYFASLLGTMELLEPADRDLFKGFVINKFRGDMTLWNQAWR